jgi:hypothetical protein
MHFAIGLEFRRAARARCDMLLHLARVPGIELAIEQRMHEELGFGASHFAFPSSAIQALRSMERARARRDITVPTGAPTASAMSR